MTVNLLANKEKLLLEIILANTCVQMKTSQAQKSCALNTKTKAARHGAATLPPKAGANEFQAGLA
jgi:hypothetical protein